MEGGEAEAGGDKLEHKANIVEAGDPEVLGDNVLHLYIEASVLSVDREATRCLGGIGHITQRLGGGPWDHLYDRREGDVLVVIFAAEFFSLLR